MDDTHSPSPVRLPGKRAHLNSPIMVPQASRADGKTTPVMAISPMPLHANNHSRRVYTPSQVRPQELPRPSVKRQNGTQLKSVKPLKKHIPFT